MNSRTLPASGLSNPAGHPGAHEALDRFVFRPLVSGGFLLARVFLGLGPAAEILRAEHDHRK